MFIRTSVLPVLTLLSASAAVVAAFPAGRSSSTTSEVIPGPGLPSLASLNLTSAELYGSSPASELASRQAYGYNPSCEYYSTGAVNDAIACMNYLYGLGDTACTITGPKIVSWFCWAGSVAISGNVMFTQPPVSSKCSDVASAVQWVVNNCNNGGQVGGFQAANGNINLIVATQNMANWLQDEYGSG